MTKFRKSLLIFGLLTLIIVAALGTFVVLSVIGSIKSEPIELEFTVEDAEQEYNGEALKATSYYLSAGRLVEGHTFEVTVKGEQIDVGEGDSTLEVKLFNENGYDVSDEYSVKVNGGKLKVTKCGISIKLKDKDVIYGGETFGITDSDYDVTGGNLPKGHRVSLNIKDEWAQNTSGWKNGAKALTAKDVDIIIFDSNGRNVSENYFSDISGSFRLVKRPITLAPLSAEKTYDGRELTCTQYSISKGSLAVGHYIAEPVFKGLSGENAVVKNANEDSPLIVLADAQIYDADGNNVTQFYDIQSDRATLTVRRANLTIVAKSVSREYDGKELTLADDTEPLSCTGLATGETVTVEYEGSVKGIGSAENIIKSHTVSDGGNNNYNVTYKSGVLEVTKANLNVALKNSVKEYDGLPFYLKEATKEQANFGSVSDFYTVTLPDGFTVSECELDGILEEAELCNTTYNLKTFKVADADGKDVSDCFNVVSKPAVCRINRCAVNLFQTEGTLSKVYDGNFDFSSGIGFADDKLVSSHSFKSVTVASFTPDEGMTEDAVMQSVPVVSFSIVDSVGRDAIGYYDIQNLKTFRANVVIMRKPLEISTLSYNKEYDGIAVGGDLTYGLLAPSDRVVVTEAVLQSDYTEEKKNKPVFAIYNDKNEIVTDFYKLTEDYGTIKISKKSLLVSLEYCEIEYSGVDLAADNATLVNNIRCDALNPDNFKLTLNGETTSIGEKTVQIDWKETNETNDNYSLSYGNLKFDIVKRKFTCPINAANAQKYYDGQPLIMSDMDSNLIDNSGLDCSIDINTFNCISSNILGEVNAYNYPATLVYENATDRITVNGEYNILKSTVQIVSRKKHEKNYDGKPYSFDTNDLVLKIHGTDTELTSLKVRDYTATEVTAASSVPQSVEISAATIVIASTGEPVGKDNVEYETSNISVTINRQRLNMYIDSTKFVEGVNNYNPNLVIIADGLAEGNRIEYIEDATVAKIGATAFFEVYDSTKGEYRFTIYDAQDNDVTTYYIIPTEDLH